MNYKDFLSISYKTRKNTNTLTCDSYNELTGKELFEMHSKEQFEKIASDIKFTTGFKIQNIRLVCKNEVFYF